MPKTTKEDYNLFVSECRYFLHYYGFSEWNVEFEHTDKDCPQEGAHAWFVASNEDKNAFITFTKTWNMKSTPENIRLFAHHEVVELLLHRLDMLCRQRYGVTEEHVDEARHEIIMRLQNTVFQQSLKERGLVKND